MATDPRGSAPGRAGGRRARRWLTSGAAGAALALVAACGSPPDHQYVANADRSIVVKLPASWASLDPTALGYPKSTSQQWMAFYDGAGQADTNDFSNKLPISGPDNPVVQLVTLARNGDSGPVPETVLRDLITPGTPHEVTKFANQAFVDNIPVTNYNTLDETVDTAQATGVRIRSLFSFNIKPLVAKRMTDKPTEPDVSVIVDKLAVADRAGKHIHVIQIWCSAQCYLQNEQLIDQILSTYTVKAQS